MAQYRLNAYDADVFIPEFKGLMQYGDQMGTDLRFSPDCMNVETPGGVLQPATKQGLIRLYYDIEDDQFDPQFQLLGRNNVTICGTRMTNTGTYFSTSAFGGDFDGTGTEVVERTNIAHGSEYDAFILILNNRGFFEITCDLQKDKHGRYIYNNALVTSMECKLISAPEYEDDWSWCVYEKPMQYGKTNIIVMTSPKNGTYIYDGNGNIDHITEGIPENLRFVARYSERIWGVGAGEDRDIIYYSRPYDAYDWSIAGPDEQPEDGGGMIRLPMFDDDSINSMVSFGDSLIVFSEQRAWRITGSDPGSFYIQEQYGNGTIFPNTIAVIKDRIMMLTEKGMVTYDGNTVTPFAQESTYELFRERLSYWDKNEPVAIYHGSKYVLALNNKIYHTTAEDPFIVATDRVVDDGYVLIVYDTVDSAVTVADSPIVCSVCHYANDAFALVSDKEEDDPHENWYYLYLNQIRFDSFATKSVSPNAVKWVSPWIDFGRKDIQKGGFELYFYPELNTDDPTDSVTLKFTMQTEKKKKSKSYVVHALTDAERTADKKHKQKRLHFGGAGRRFRLIIETEAGNTVPWRLIGGIHIIAEIDKD